MRRAGHSRCSPLRAGPAALALGLLTACATPQENLLAGRRAGVEKWVSDMGLEEDPAVHAARAELDAAMAVEETLVAIDGVEIRAAAVQEKDTKMTGLLRLPVGNVFALSAQRDAMRAETEVALAKLEEVTLAQHVVLCLPSVRHLALQERKQLFDGYERRYRALVDWNQELRAAGMLDEVRLSRFELTSQVRLATRDPSSIPSPMAHVGTDRVLDALPDIALDVDPLPTDPELVRKRLLKYQPEVGVHRASHKRLEALARSEDLKRMPSLRFVDIGFEPVAFPGDTNQWAARVALEIPFGRQARANTQRYEALARAEQGWEQALVEERLGDAMLALTEINLFRERSPQWLQLTLLADTAEEVADRWWNSRLTDPSQISNLLDAVYSARLAVLDARERAGLAGCAVTAATGLSVSEWK